MRNLLYLSVLLLTLFSCQKQDSYPKEQSRQSTSRSSAYVGGYYKGNYIWTAAMPLAWKELTTSSEGEGYQIISSNPQAALLINKLNRFTFSPADIDSNDYYIKNGRGQSTIDKINHDLKAKFVGRTIRVLSTRLADNHYISYSSFMKKPYSQHEFLPTRMRFNHKRVAAFRKRGADFLDVMQQDYVDDNHFVLAIKLNNPQERLYLAKGFPMESPDSVIAWIRHISPVTDDATFYNVPDISPQDYFVAPVISLKCLLSYDYLSGSALKTQCNLHLSNIHQVFSDIGFTMDGSGSIKDDDYTLPEVEVREKYHPKHYVLNKPFWIIMKHYDSDNPYFIMGVNNTECMETNK